MKRCLKKVLDWFNKMKNKIFSVEKLLYIVCFVVAIGVAMYTFLVIDKVPATAADYESLEKQVALIQQNPEMLFKEDYVCSISDGVIEVEIENIECKLIVKYNQNFEILSISKIDNYTYWALALIPAFGMGCLGCVAVFSVWLLVIILLLILESLFSKIYELIFRFTKR